jgi:hypothetical protein
MRMARYGLNVLKRFTYRGGVQHFGNTYYYETPIAAGDTAALNALADEVVAKEKAMFSTAVTFVQARLWSAGGGPASNNMIVDKALTGTGAAGANTFMPREMAFLVRFRAGNDSRGRPVYLRKWWHLDIAALAGTGITNPELQNTAELAAAKRTALETFADSIKTLSPSGQTATLVAKSGRQIDGATTAHRFLEHRQLGDEWRGA